MTLHTGDCVEVMAGMEPASVDAIVTDPPYGLEFMGKEWDRLISQGSAADPDRTVDLPVEPRSPKYTRRHAGASFGVDPRNEGGFQEASGGNPFSRSRVRYGTSEAAKRGMQDWHERWATEAFRIAKPGAYLLAFGGTRTYHRMTCAIEDAGWIIRDCLVWAYASGFPKSKALLKPAWEPIVMARKPGPLRELAIDACRIVSGPTATIDAWENDLNLCVSCAEDADYPERPGTPATGASTTRRRAERQPNGWAMFDGTSGDPATSVSNGTTADSGGTSSSIGRSGRTRTVRSLTATSFTTSTETRPTIGSRTCISCGAAITPTTIDGTRFDTETGQPAPTTNGNTVVGRWPANLVLTDSIFDGDTPGVVGGGRSDPPGGPGRQESYPVGMFGTGDQQGPLYFDGGTYSRFFLVPKAARAEREPGFRGRPIRYPTDPLGTVRVRGELVDRETRLPWGEQDDLERDGVRSGPDAPDAGRGGERAQVHSSTVRGRNGPSSGDVGQASFLDEETTHGDTRTRANVHPTVKPLDLMRHLVRLVTPAGGTVLDPFLGSGTTALAAEMEGFRWVGIEKEPEYVAIAEARLNGTQRGLGLHDALV